jgi:hypothetical protein
MANTFSISTLRFSCWVHPTVILSLVASWMMAVEYSRDHPLWYISFYNKGSLMQMVTERDKAMRAAALAAVEALYLAEGPAVVWGQLGKLTDQQRSLIEERLKYTERAAARTGVPTGLTQRGEEEARSAPCLDRSRLSLLELSKMTSIEPKSVGAVPVGNAIRVRTLSFLSFRHPIFAVQMHIAQRGHGSVDGTS